MQPSTSWIGKHQFTSHPIKGTQSCLLRGMYHCRRIGMKFIRLTNWEGVFGKPLGNWIKKIHYAFLNLIFMPWEQGSWGQHGAHLGPIGTRWAPCWPHKLCYLGMTEYDKEHFLGVCISPYWTIMIIFQRKFNNLITYSPRFFFSILPIKLTGKTSNSC